MWGKSVVELLFDAGKVVFAAKPIRLPKLLLKVTNCGTKLPAVLKEPTLAALRHVVQQDFDF